MACNVLLLLFQLDLEPSGRLLIQVRYFDASSLGNDGDSIAYRFWFKHFLAMLVDSGVKTRKRQEFL
jgi:hypothetical protein